MWIYIWTSENKKCVSKFKLRYYGYKQIVRNISKSDMQQLWNFTITTCSRWTVWFFCKMKLECDACELVKIKIFKSDKISNASGIMRQSFDINKMVIQVFLHFGCGYSALHTFCMYTNMHAMSSRVFNVCKKILHKSVTNTSEKNLEKIQNWIRRFR